MQQQNINFQQYQYFPSSIYIANTPQFAKAVKTVAEESFRKIKKDTKIPKEQLGVMSYNFHDDPRLLDFSNFVLTASWDILKNQGYSMDSMKTVFESMWAQEHHQYSLMEQHVHGFGLQMVGFYFYEAPSASSRVCFYDPRPGKVQISLPESDVSQATQASQIVNFTPNLGDIYFTNAWLAHSFSMNVTKKNFKFVHFNIGCLPTQYVNTAPAGIQQPSFSVNPTKSSTALEGGAGSATQIAGTSLSSQVEII
jgi:hypothetical protein